jgi:hypothetical protein
LPKRSDWPGCCESQIRAPGRGSVSRSTSAPAPVVGITPKLGTEQLAADRRPAVQSPSAARRAAATASGSLSARSSETAATHGRRGPAPEPTPWRVRGRSHAAPTLLSVCSPHNSLYAIRPLILLCVPAKFAPSTPCRCFPARFNPSTLQPFNPSTFQP